MHVGGKHTSLDLRLLDAISIIFVVSKQILYSRLCVFQIGVAFYEMLQAVDQHCQHLSYMDPICDFLYHIKYMYTGDSVKEQVSLSVCLETFIM